MPEPANSKAVYRFGLFELDADTGELRKDGVLRPRIQGQPFEVLMQLLNRPADVVTREELRLQLWPSDTFVDYDHSLNTAVNKLRDALSDSAENPRFIQTIPRRGYRFIASVQVHRNGSPEPVGVTPEGATVAAVPALGNRKTGFGLSDPHDLPAAPRGVVQILFALIQLMYLSFYVVSLARMRSVETILSQATPHSRWLLALLLVTALAGIPVRLYLLSAILFGYHGLPVKFLRLFPFIIPLDELWALAPFLLADEIGVGLALAATAGLLYLPFSQRSLMLMGEHLAEQRSGGKAHCG